MLLRLNDTKISNDTIRKIVTCLKDGGIIIYPTDTVYAVGGDITSARAFERICKLKGVAPAKSNFSFVCSDLSHLSEYTKPISNSVFRIMKRALPGPYTFILEASSKVPKLLKQERKTVGIRVPKNTICNAIVTELGNPIISTSLHDNSDDILEYFSDPETIFQQYGALVDMVIDGGYGNIHPSTVLDCSGEEVQIVREGAGSLDILQ